MELMRRVATGPDRCARRRHARRPHLRIRRPHRAHGRRPHPRGRRRPARARATDRSPTMIRQVSSCRWSRRSAPPSPSSASIAREPAGAWRRRRSRSPRSRRSCRTSRGRHHRGEQREHRRRQPGRRYRHEGAREDRRRRCRRVTCCSIDDRDLRAMRLPCRGAGEGSRGNPRAPRVLLKLAESVPTSAISAEDLSNRRSASRSTRRRWRPQGAGRADRRRASTAPGARAGTGQIPQVKTRPGEFAAAGVMATPLMRCSATTTNCTCASTSTNDAWRFAKAPKRSRSCAAIRRLETKLRFVRTEPYVVPKVSLTE